MSEVSVIVSVASSLALTADAVQGAKEKYLASGFNDYISKPFSRDQIKEKLDNYI